MPTLTVRDAAQRLGVKPSKVRLLISEHKLSARAMPAAGGETGRRRDRVLLDADEVETLAQLRAYKRRSRHHTDASGSSDKTADDEATANEQSETIVGPVRDGALPDDPASRRTVALVQAMLAPLVAELHDARETIRRQAEELGALHATVAELQAYRLSQTDAAANATDAQPATIAASVASAARALNGARDNLPAHQLPVWRRALVVLVRGR